ncbi:hypothetical protein RM844_23225 [Streptomyces sp. DSM 44915]|uniref:Uncharacterized protein n=1 Tax=Streptomyces chisholmiae TaxID=3075540 RepID=A0ABU2JW34_9ACTN|nr:hypothetical protein [Streptomyces sp. DSM 44915]MDT0269202.1 hypothetical protein [Streptomyces sp. DSM 44915]
MAVATRTQCERKSKRLSKASLPPLVGVPAQTAARELPLTSEPSLGDLAPLTAEQPLAAESPLVAEPSGRGGAEAIGV